MKYKQNTTLTNSIALQLPVTIYMREMWDWSEALTMYKALATGRKKL